MKSKIDMTKGFLNAIKEASKDVELVSFDIFDTLLARKIEPPETIHQTLCRLLVSYLNDRITQDRLIACRREAELNLRHRALDSGLDFECHYIDLLEEWVRLILGRDDEALVTKIREIELFLELKALYVKEWVDDLLTFLKKNGKKVIVASDMYLGPNEIKTILDKKGLLTYMDRVYVSSTLCECKYSGKLFKKILDDFSLKPSQMLHVGDNVISDYSMPAGLGIKAIHLKEPDEEKRRKVLAHYQRLSEKNGYWKGRHQLQITYSHEEHLIKKAESEQENGFYHQYGRDVLGPIFATYVLGVHEKAVRYGIDLLLFLARDGFLLQRLYELLLDIQCSLPLSPQRKPAIEYAYLTRHTTASAAVHLGLNMELARLALYNPKQEGLFSILKAFGLRPEDFLKEAQKYGFDPIRQHIDDWNDPRLIEFLGDDEVKQKIKANSKENFVILKEYLSEIGFFSHKKIGLVDIGWNGTIQFFLGRCFSNMKDYPEIYGLYFAFCAGIPYNFSPKDHIEGLFYDRSRGFSTENYVISFEELFEEAARALDATTIGYEKDPANGKTRPLFKDDNAKDRRQEIECNPIVEQLQNGILEFAKDFFEDLFLTGYSFSELRPFMLSLGERAVVYPRKKEVEMLSKIVHTEDWGYDNILEVNTDGNIFNLPKMLRASNWKYGLLKKWLGWPSVMVARFMDIWHRG